VVFLFFTHIDIDTQRVKYTNEKFVYISLFIFIASVVLLSHSFNKPELIIAFLDVGQGDAIYIRTPRGRTMLIDGGKNREVLYEISKVHPFYDRSIDIVALSHPDLDHIGGLIPVIEQYDVLYAMDTFSDKESEEYSLFKEILSEHIFHPESGYIIVLEDGIHIEVLWPHSGITNLSDNEGSLVLRLEYHDTSVLLTGDIGFETETHLLDMYGRSLMSDILKVGHHGSGFSTSKDWIQKVDPDISVLSYGCENRYGHPHERVHNLIHEYGEVYDTCKQGTVILSSDGKKWKRK